MIDKYRVKLTLLRDQLGTNPIDPNIQSTHILEKQRQLILEKGEFYLLTSKEKVRIPPQYAAEMVAYEETSGELRTHYAGFFDPGFGYGREGEIKGTVAVMEIRALDAPFMVEDGQRFCKLQLERMAGIRRQYSAGPGKKCSWPRLRGASASRAPAGISRSSAQGIAIGWKSRSQSNVEAIHEPDNAFELISTLHNT